jgi:hypothetical protein
VQGIANSLSGHVLHESGLKGGVKMVFQESHEVKHGTSNDKDADVHGVRIWDEEGKCLVWACESNEVKVLPSVGSPEHERVFQIAGDGWVNGGVKDTLDDCVRECAMALGFVRQGAGMRRHMCSPEDAIRDAAVVWALLASSKRLHHLEIRDAHASRWVSPAHVLEEACAQRSPWHEQPAGREQVFNVLGSRSHVPWRKIRCFSTADVQHILAFWGRQGQGHARAVGADQSWSDCGVASGARIDMRRLSRIIRVESICDEMSGQDLQVVRVEPGCSLRELTSALKGRGLCIASLPVLLDQTVGGAIATGSHGSSIRYGTLSDAVYSMTLVDTNGTMQELCGQHDAARAARMSRGHLGIATELRLFVHPAYYVRPEVRMLSWDQIPGIESSAEHVWVHVRLGATDEEGAAAVALCLHMTQEGKPDARMYDGCNWPFPHALPPVPPDMHDSESECSAGVWLSMQYAIPLARIHDVIGVLRGMPQQHKGMRGRLVELKYIKRSCFTLMGPNAERVGGGKHGEDVVCCNLWWRR